MKAIESAVRSEHPDAADVKPWSVDDVPLFAELRAVLKRHGALSRFGITLLREPFDVCGNESLIEVCDRESRTLTTRPRSEDDVSGATLIETNWRLDSPVAVRECEKKCVGTTAGHKEIHRSVDRPAS
jgi:hypothetical protein